MRRIGRWGRIKPGCEEEYIRLHRQMSQELRAVHSKAGLSNFSVFRRGCELFSFLEVEDWEMALAYLAKDPLAQEWSRRMLVLLDDPLPWPEMQEVWHLD